MNQNLPIGQANWRVADLANANPKDAFYLGGLGLLIGIVAGCVIALFRICKGNAYEFMVRFAGAHKDSIFSCISLFVLAVIAALIVGFLIKNPAIKFGGAPWIGKTLQQGQDKPWLKILMPKFLGSWLVLACGVSVGSEGPCIQMGAATAVGLKKFDSRNTVERRYFIMSGCACGLAAAFSAPFAGICYVYEIMNERLSKPLFIFLLSGGIGVYLSCTVLFGLGVILPLPDTALPDLKQSWILIPFGILTGLIGSAYNYAIRLSIKVYNKQNLIPSFWLPLFPFIAAAIFLLLFPEITGEGMGIFAKVEIEKTLINSLYIFIAAKLIFTAFCYGSGIPAGLMVPILAIGGVCGIVFADWAIALHLLPPLCGPGCMAMGMAGAFAAAERAPITGLILVTEITGLAGVGAAVLLVAAIASFTARILKIQSL